LVTAPRSRSNVHRVRYPGPNDLGLPSYIIVLREQAWKKGSETFGQVRYVKGRKDPIFSIDQIDAESSATELQGSLDAIRFVSRIKTKPGGRTRLEDDPGWRAAMREIDTYTRRNRSTTLRTSQSDLGTI